MKITRLPNKINANEILKEKIKEMNSVCPFCGESRNHIVVLIKEDKCAGVDCIEYETYYGRLPQDKFKFWKKVLYLRIDSYHCWTCGCEWETDPYPQNLGGMF